MKHQNIYRESNYEDYVFTGLNHSAKTSYHQNLDIQEVNIILVV